MYVANRSAETAGSLSASVHGSTPTSGPVDFRWSTHAIQSRPEPSQIPTKIDQDGGLLQNNIPDVCTNFGGVEEIFQGNSASGQSRHIIQGPTTITSGPYDYDNLDRYHASAILSYQSPFMARSDAEDGMSQDHLPYLDTASEMSDFSAEGITSYYRRYSKAGASLRCGSWYNRLAMRYNRYTNILKFLRPSTAGMPLRLLEPATPIQSKLFNLY
jgi:hypothetical protein